MTRLGLVAVIVAGCTSSSEPSMLTDAIWVDPFQELVAITWAAPADCPIGQSGSCSQDVDFTIESVSCEGCQIVSDQDAIDVYPIEGYVPWQGPPLDETRLTPPPAFTPDGTRYSGTAWLWGLPTTLGPLTITAVVRATATGETQTVWATATGDYMSGLVADCYTEKPVVGACGPTRTGTDPLVIVPSVETINHGAFTLDSLDPDLAYNPGSHFDRSSRFTSLPAATPDAVTWKMVDYLGGGGLGVEIDGTTLETVVKLRWKPAFQHLVSTSVGIPSH